MKILFWVGYYKNKWGPNSKNIAGSEIAAIKIAENLKLFGHEIVVSGDVLNIHKNGVVWCGLENIHNDHFNTFDIIVGLNYAHVAKEFEQYDCEKVIWAHNTEIYHWWRGEDMPEYGDILDWRQDYIRRIICLTHWHGKHLIDYHSWHADKISLIGNGIDKNDFIGNPVKKPNSFIWSSAVDRGLEDLLKNWHKIKSVLPDASLNVFFPEYSYDVAPDLTNKLINSREELLKADINIVGPVDQESLHDAMLRSEFWCYLTDYEETYCITALEMQYAGVMPIVTKVAGLQESVATGIMLENNETKWDILVKTLGELSPSLKKFSQKKGRQWAGRQTWYERAFQWNLLLTHLVNNEDEEDPYKDNAWKKWGKVAQQHAP